MTICIEGNIGSGKSTLISYLQSYSGLFCNDQRHSRNTCIRPESLETWRNIEGENLLDAFYKDPTAYAFQFQSYIQLYQYRTHLSRPCIMERSIYSSFNIFVEALHSDYVLTDIEYHILKGWHDQLTSPREHNQDVNGTVKPTFIVYVRASPTVCLSRIFSRKRPEETDVTLEYLEELHRRHDSWLLSSSFTESIPVVVLDGDCSRLDIHVLYQKLLSYITGEARLTTGVTILSVDDRLPLISVR